MKILRVTSFVLLLAIITNVLAQAATSIDKEDVVEPNHFYSASSVSKLYNIGSLNKDKALAIVLKSQQGQMLQKYDNPVTITLNIGSEKKQCSFKSKRDLCTLQSISKESGTMEVKCEHTPCEATWKLIQPQIKQLQSGEHINKFYKLSSDDPRRLHLNIICESIQISDISKMFRAYSSLDFFPFIQEKSAYILFPNPKPGYIYFQMEKKFVDCAKINVNRLPKALAQSTISDLLLLNFTSTYQLSDIPDHDFRIDMAMHMLAPSSQSKNNSVNIKIVGMKGDSRQVLRQNDIRLPKTLLKTMDISYAVHKIPSEYKNITFEVSTNSMGVLMDFNTGEESQQLVEPGQRSFFDLKKGEKLSYKLMKIKDVENQKKVKVYLFDEKKINTTKTQCDIDEGCQFEIQAIEDAKGFIFMMLGDTSKPGDTEEAVIIDMDSNTYTKKLKEGDGIYLRKKLEKGKGFQVLLNTANAMVYMATNKKCPVPSKTCYDRIGTYYRHFVFVPKEDDKQAIFFVEAYDNCEFTLTILYEEDDEIRLTDSQPFSYLMDNKEEQLKFVFTRSSKVDVSFNLVAPLHSLDLIVENGKKISDDYESSQISTEGFLEFKASDNKKDDFAIVVKKKDDSKQSFVHFTLIASTKGKQVRLESGMTYYETLPQHENKKSTNNAEYVFQFDDEKDYVVNFHCQSLDKEQQVDIKMALAAGNDWEKLEKDQIMFLTINKINDILDLNDVSEKLCINSGQGETNCELFMHLQNNMDKEVDISITLMSRNQVIELRSGLWQSFDLHSVAKTAHFYYSPKKKDSDVNIYFKTSDSDVRLSYRLYSGGYDTMNPSQWPFPTKQSSQVDKHKNFKPVRHISISKKEIMECYPFCLVLMSIIELQQSPQKGSFSLMASDSIVQLQQKSKYETFFSAEQEKVFLLDLKYPIDQNTDVFFYSFVSMGVVNLYANVYSQKNNRIPDEQEHDFKLHHQQIIEIDKIKEIIEEESMDEHNNIYLYIVGQALNDAKISLQFLFEEKDAQTAKFLDYDDFEKVSIGHQSNIIYYTVISEPFELKITRQTGYPYLYTLNCKQKFNKCIEEIKDEENIGTQILSKVSANTAIPCEKCVYFFKITTKQDSVTLNLHLQSATSQIDLPESKQIYDFTEKEEANRYTIYGIKGEEIFVNVDVTEGEAEVLVTDMHSINMKKTGKQLITFTIPTKAQSQEYENRQKQKQMIKKALDKTKKEQQNQEAKKMIQYIQKNGIPTNSYMSAFGLSDKFTVLHVEVKSNSPGKQTIYTLSYSSGELEFDLEDGLITEYELNGGKDTTFYYYKKHKGHLHLLVSMDNTKKLKDLTLSLKYCEPKDSIIDEDCWTEFKADKPPIKDKTPNPTIMYSLPTYQYFAFTLNYEGSGSAKVSLGINNQQVVLLPVDKDYPFILHQNENIYMITQISNPGNFYVTVRKCFDSNPNFAYTFDYQSFQNEEFDYETALQNPKSEFFTKVKPGTMYMKFSSTDPAAVMSINIHFETKKIKQNDMQAGGKGQMSYQIVGAQKAKLTLKPPVCSGSSCSGKIKYSIMTSSKKVQLYSQLVCPSSYFDIGGQISKQTLKEEEVSPTENSDGTISLEFSIADQISYVGVRAADSKGKQVFYSPIQIATLWGSLSRSSQSHKWAIMGVVVISLLALVIFVRRKNRGYIPVNQDY